MIQVGYRVIWVNEVQEIKAQVLRIFKEKAQILTADLEKITVPLDELEIAPLPGKKKPVLEVEEKLAIGTKVRAKYQDLLGIGTILAIEEYDPKEKPGKYWYRCQWGRDTLPGEKTWFFTDELIPVTEPIPPEPQPELCPDCKHFDRHSRFCSSWSIKFDEGDETFNECPSFDSVSALTTPDTESSPTTLGADTESSPIAIQLNDSVSPFIYRETAADDDSVSPSMLIPNHGVTIEGDSDVDSVSRLLTGDTESIPEATSEDDSVSEGDTESQLQYSPRGTARGGNRYFRFSYRWDGRMRHRHIPGGNTDNRIAQDRWEEVKWMKRSGRSTEEILVAIDSWH